MVLEIFNSETSIPKADHARFECSPPASLLPGTFAEEGRLIWCDEMAYIGIEQPNGKINMGLSNSSASGAMLGPGQVRQGRTWWCLESMED